jgi:SAM-dependent methyltransferase
MTSSAARQTPNPDNSPHSLQSNPKAVIEHGYDKIAPALGCGAGVPCTQALVAAGHRVTGVDISAAQIALAQDHVPEAKLVHADMMALSFLPNTFDAVVGFYSIFHLPKEEQGIMIGRITEWLKERGWLLCNFHTEYGDMVRKDWFSPGVDMFSSGLGVRGNKEMFEVHGV